MPKINRKLEPLPIFDEASLLNCLDDLDVSNPVYHMRAIFKFLTKTPGIKDLSRLDEIPSFPSRLIKPIQAKFELLTSKVVEAHTSEDGSTTKLLIELQDGLQVETVVIRHGATTALNPNGESRTTLCVSSQVGCKMGCTFCATGTMGEIGNLYSGEICEQLVHARAYSDIRNVVYMGLGEPFNNYDNVVGAVRSMTDSQMFNLSPRRVTVSTVGVVPRIYDFIKDLPNVNLALSLHAPTQELRKTFVPAARTWDLDTLMASVEAYIKECNKKILVEYVLLAGVNDSKEVAHQLGKLLQPYAAFMTLNVIPYNPTEVTIQYEAPKSETTYTFADIVKTYGPLVTIRKEMGQDISGACGQLVVSSTPTSSQPKDIEDIITGSGSSCSSPKSKKAIDGIIISDAPLWPAISQRPSRKGHTKQKGGNTNNNDDDTTNSNNTNNNTLILFETPLARTLFGLAYLTIPFLLSRIYN